MNRTEADVLGRGSVFRNPAQYPYEEDVVDFMLMENPHSRCGMSLWVTTGYKAGLPWNNLPMEPSNPKKGLSRTNCGVNQPSP